MELRSIGLIAWLFAVPAVWASSYDCPDPWMDYSDSCIKFVIYDYSLGMAEELCNRDGARLISINNEAEHNFIATWLGRGANTLRKWYTSGRQLSGTEPSFFWEGDGSNITGSLYGLDLDNPGEGDRIVYAYSGNSWGWQLIEPNQDLPFMCEILKDEIYRIVEAERDFFYGLDSTDPAATLRGPKIRTQPQDFIYDVDSVEEFLSIECIATGNPLPDYEWWLDREDGEIKVDPMSNERYTLTNGRLIIHDPSQNHDNGDYQCRAHNMFGTVLSNKVQISFGYLLEFSRTVRDPVTVEEYSGVGIECNPPNHYPAILYSWTKDNTLNFVTSMTKPYVFISRNGKLYFSQVTEDDVGSYYCHVSSPRAGVSSLGGKVSTAIRLQVTRSVGAIYEPEIASGFPAIFPSSPLQGQNIAIECFAWATDDLLYSWQRMGEPMPDRTYFTEYNRILHIPNVQLIDAGIYKCTCVRVNGQSDSENVQLHVDAIPFFTVPIRDQHIDIGGTMSLSCIANGIPAVSYDWYVNGTELTLDSILSSEQPRFTIQHNSLTITGMKEEDQGMYQCAATNLYGTRFSTAQVRILGFAPTFSKNPVQQNTYGTRLGNVTIICNPEAAPRAEKQWKRNGNYISFTINQNGNMQSGNMHLLPNGNLEFVALTLNNAAVYTCEASNQFGTASSSGNLTILSSTTITIVPAQNAVIVNGTAFLPCHASYNPQIDVTYMWYHNSRAVDFVRVRYIGNKVSIVPDEHYERGSGINNGGLYIKRAQFYHEGHYTCVVESSTETKERSVDLYVHGPPSQPAGVFGSDETQNSVRLTWKVTRNNGGHIQSYIVDAMDKLEGVWREVKTNIRVSYNDEEDPSTVVETLNANSNYTFRVHAVNMYGIGEPSDPSPQIHTSKAPPFKFPANVGGGGGKVGTLTITWTPIPVWQHNGDTLEYRIRWKKYYLEEDEWEEDVVRTSTTGIYTALIGEDNFYMQYDVQIVAKNEVGDGPPSPVVRIWSAEDIPTGTPTNVQAELYNSTALMVMWHPVEDTREKIKGVLLGYRINYWKEEGGSETMAIYRPLAGQRDHGLIIGLEPHTYYFYNVQVFNTAGNGPKSMDNLEETLRSAPKNAPQEVKVEAVSDTTINVKWRGVQTNQEEEPLQGYYVRYWRASESYYQAYDIDANRENHIQVSGLEPNVLYNLRVLGYSLGGQGLASSPIIQFILGENCNVLEASPERRFVYTCGSCAQQFSLALLPLLLVLHMLSR